MSKGKKAAAKDRFLSSGLEEKFFSCFNWLAMPTTMNSTSSLSFSTSHVCSHTLISLSLSLYLHLHLLVSITSTSTALPYAEWNLFSIQTGSVTFWYYFFYFCNCFLLFDVSLNFFCFFLLKTLYFFILAKQLVVVVNTADEFY